MVARYPTWLRRPSERAVRLSVSRPAEVVGDPGVADVAAQRARRRPGRQGPRPQGRREPRRFRADGRRDAADADRPKLVPGSRR